MQYTKDQMRNLEVPLAVQNRADFLFNKGNQLLLTAKDDKEREHAENCYRRAMRVLDEGSRKFPKEQFMVTIPKKAFDMLMEKGGQSK